MLNDFSSVNWFSLIHLNLLSGMLPEMLQWKLVPASSSVPFLYTFYHGSFSGHKAWFYYCLSSCSPFSGIYLRTSVLPAISSLFCILPTVLPFARYTEAAPVGLGACIRTWNWIVGWVRTAWGLGDVGYGK